jgi:DNA-binding NarL/FixJ family response regulator
VNRPTIALVDDHPLVSYSIVTALGAVGITCVPIPPAPLPEMQAAILDAAPSLVLLDLDLGSYGSSLPLIEPLTVADIRVVMLTAESDRVRLAEALESGASRIVMKSADFTELIATIREAATEPATRRDPFTVQLLAELHEHRRQQADSRAPFESLTAREKEVLTSLASGGTVHSIAHSWVVSETTIRSHVRAILLKLNVQSQLQAVVKAIRNGWVPRDEPRFLDEPPA